MQPGTEYLYGFPPHPRMGTTGIAWPQFGKPYNPRVLGATKVQHAGGLGWDTPP